MKRQPECNSCVVPEKVEKQGPRWLRSTIAFLKSFSTDGSPGMAEGSRMGRDQLARVIRQKEHT